MIEETAQIIWDRLRRALWEGKPDDFGVQLEIEAGRKRLLWRAVIVELADQHEVASANGNTAAGALEALNDGLEAMLSENGYDCSGMSKE